MLGKSEKHILPNGGEKWWYHGTNQKKSPQKQIQVKFAQIPNMSRENGWLEDVIQFLMIPFSGDIRSFSGD